MVGETRIEPKRVNWWLLLVLISVILVIIFAMVRFWTGILVFFVQLLLNLSLRLVSRAKATNDGGYILNYGSGMTWFAIISALILCSLFCYAAIFIPAAPGSDLVALAMGFMGLFTILVWPMFIEGTFSWYVVNNDGIDKHSAWSRHFFMRWDEVHSIEFTAVNQWFVIKGDKGTIRIHANLNGLPEFAQHVRMHVPQERWVAVRENIEALVKNGSLQAIIPIARDEIDGNDTSPNAKARKVPKRP